MKFSKDVLKIDPEHEAEKICVQIREFLSGLLKRRGLVVGLSGGIDSSVTAALSVRALGPERVLALLMPEHHSDDETIKLSTMVADHLGVEKIHEDISDILKSVGFYKRYNDAVRLAIPEYGDDWKSKIVTPNILESRGFSLFSVIAQDPDGKIVKAGAPILYYKADTAGKEIRQVYDYRDNEVLILLKAREDGKPHPLDDPTGASFYDYIEDPRITAKPWPYNPSSYILISAGTDGIYGTEDDIRNFGD